MSRFSYQLGEIIDSQALKADALHHRSDVIATALVVVALIATRFGQTSIISLHIEVSDNDSVFELHNLSEEVEQEISRKTGGTVVAHIDPINKEHPQYEAITETVGEIILEDKRVNSFHDLRIIGLIKEKFKIEFPVMKTIIKAEPKYAYST